jgi:SNF2 family DNA or RNA helicase
MSPTTVFTFAADLGIPVNMLLIQFASAGIEKHAPDDEVSEQDKSCLLIFLSKAHGNRLIKENAIGSAPQSSLNYSWPRHANVNPYAHQIKTTEFLVQHEKAFCLNDMGTGKTLSTLWAYDYLQQSGMARSMLIICPLSTMVSTWQVEICKHFRLGSKILHGDGAARRKALSHSAHIYIMNHDGLIVPGMLDALLLREDIDVVVIDEIASFRNAATNRWKALSKVLKGRKYIWGLTGTPIPNKPSDAWAQCRLIAPSRVSPYFRQFQDLVERKISELKYVPRENALDIVQDAMQPSIRYKRDDCLSDLPPVVYETHKIDLTAAQAQAYAQMRLQLRAEIDGKVISAVNARVMATKLLQIACGAVRTNATGDDKVAFIPAENRLSLVKEIIENAGGNVIVFVPFRGVLAYVAEFLSKAFSVAAIHGGVSRSNRDRIFDDFQNKKTVRVLVSIPHAMSHGLNLTAANTIIWFGPIYSNDVYQQANARITRPGQKRSQLIVNIEGTVAEQVIYKGLHTRQKMQDLLLEMLA